MSRKALLILALAGALLAGCGKTQLTSKEPTSKPAASAPAKPLTGPPTETDSC